MQEEHLPLHPSATRFPTLSRAHFIIPITLTDQESMEEIRVHVLLALITPTESVLRVPLQISQLQVIIAHQTVLLVDHLMIVLVVNLATELKVNYLLLPAKDLQQMLLLSEF